MGRVATPEELKQYESLLSGATSPGTRQLNLQPGTPAPPEILEWYNQAISGESEDSEFVKGLKRGVHHTKALGVGASAMLADLAGFDDFAARQVEDYQRIMRDAQRHEATIPNVESIQSPGQLATWLAGILGEQVPIIAGFIVTGGIGGILSKAVAKKAITSGTKKLIEQKIAAWTTRGQLAGAFSYGTALEGGGVYGEQIEANLPTSPGVALTAGALAGALEILPVVTVARSLGLGPKFTSSLMKNIGSLPLHKKVAAMSALIGTQEAGTEAAQEVIALAARSFVDDNFEVLGEEGKSRILNAAAAGLGVGGTIGAATGPFTRSPGESAELDEEVQSDEIKALPPPPPSRLERARKRQEAKDLEDQDRTMILGEAPRPKDRRDERISLASPEEDVEAEGDIGATTRQGEILDALGFGGNIPVGIRHARATKEGRALSEELDRAAQERTLADRELDPHLVSQYRAVYRKGFEGTFREFLKAREEGKSFLDKRISEEERRAALSPDDLGTALVPTGRVPTGREIGPALDVLEGTVRGAQPVPQGPRPSLGGRVIEGEASLEAEGLEDLREEARAGQTQVMSLGQEIDQEYSDEEKVQVFSVEEGGTSKEEVKEAPDEIPQEPVESLTPLADEKSLEEGETLPPSGYDLLTPGEQRRYEKLVEKELLEGLSDREFDALEKIMAKMEGEKSVTREKAETVEDLIELAKEIQRDPDELLQRSGARRRNKRGLPKNLVEKIISALEKIFPNAPKVKVITIEETALDPAISNISKRSKGLFVKRAGRTEIYIIADNNTSREEVIKTWLHEVIGHNGLRDLFPDVKERKNFLRLVGEEDLVTAEERIAQLAEGVRTVPLVRRVIAFLRRMLRKAIPNLKLSEDEVKVFLREVAGRYQGTAKSLNLGKFRFSPKGPLDIEYDRVTVFTRALGEDIDNLSARNVDQLSGLWEWLKVKSAKLVLTPLQISARYNIEPIRRYLDSGVMKWWNTKMKIIVEADEVVKKWRKLDKTRSNKLGAFIFEISNRSDEQERKISNEEVREEMDRRGLDEETQAIYWSIDESFSNLLDRLELGIKRGILRENLSRAEADAFLERWEQADMLERRNLIEGAQGNVEMHKRLAEIESNFSELRNRNYFPRIRFGQYAILVKAKRALVYRGENFNEGQVVNMSTYESRSAQLGAQNQFSHFRRRADDFSVELTKLSDEEFAFLAFPPALMEEIQTGLGLSEEQRERLKDIFIRKSPGQSFLKHLRKRMGIEGYSKDAMRVYASYMFSAANHIARVEHHFDMQESLADLRKMRLEEQYADSVVLMELSEYFNKHFDYIMNPGNDLAKLRAIGFLWYLGGSVKSAAVNLTQVPMVAYPYLASVYGDGKALNQLGRAMKDIGEFFVAGRVNVLSPEEDQALTRAIEEGFIDESFVTEIAGISESPTLFRVMPDSKRSRILNQTSYAAGWLFHEAELYNRRVTFLAAHRMQLAEDSQDMEAAYQAAKKAVQVTQFEYAKWNRPTFMRGKKSVFFLFWQWMQHASFLAFGGQGGGTAMRIWAMLLLSAGLQGLPFMEHFLDFLDFASTKTKEAMGVKDPRVDLRNDLRIMIQQITDEPDMIMHGLGRYYGLGPLHLFEGIGIPVPHVDITSSLSMGRVVPGLEDLFESQRDPDKKLGRIVVDVGGPVMGIGYNFYRWATSTNPDTFKEFERTLPVAIKNVAKFVRWQARGEETSRTGAKIVDFEPENAIHRSEIWAQALGFAPTRVGQKYELIASQEEARRYYTIKRSMLMENYAFAKRNRDPEGIADARKAIKKFNHSVPAPQLRIRGEDLQRSLRQRETRRRQAERGQPPEKRFRKVFQQVQEAFPEAQSQ